MTVPYTPVGWGIRSLAQRRGCVRLQDSGLVRNLTVRKKVSRDTVEMLGLVERDTVIVHGTVHLGSSMHTFLLG